MLIAPVFSCVGAFAGTLAYRYVEREHPEEGEEEYEEEDSVDRTLQEAWRAIKYEWAYRAKKERIRAERAIREAAKERWVKEGYQDLVGKMPKTSAKGKIKPEEELSRYNKKLPGVISNSSIRIINPKLKGEEMSLMERVKFESIRAEVAIKTAAEERRAKEILQKYMTNKVVDETLRERLDRKYSLDKHNDAKDRDSPVDKGEEVTLVVEEFPPHHTGKRRALGHVRNVRTFVDKIPDSLEIGDVITATFTHYGGEKESAGHAIYEETVKR